MVILILRNLSRASEDDDDSCNTTMQKSLLPNSSHLPTGMSFADCFDSNSDVIVENFAQRRQWQILETSLLDGDQDYQLQSPKKRA